MIKEGKIIYEYYNLSHFKEVRTKPFSIDMTKEESMDLWRDILNEETTEIIVIEENNEYIGGVITVTHSPKVNMHKKDMTNAVLWDIRVHPSYQRLGLATTLLNKAIEFSKKMNCKSLLIETQNNNSKAINFYIKNKAYLHEINKGIYKSQPSEIQLIFKIDIV